MSRIEDLREALKSGKEICPVCTKPFIAGDGVLGEVEGMAELAPEDRSEGPFEFCSVKCKNEYYKAGREKRK